jgi:urease accessory protein
MSWLATLDLHYQAQDGRTVLQHVHQGPLRIFKSLYPEGPGICHNVVVHPPGGLVGGDQLRIDARLDAGAHALLSTPGATRFYRSEGPQASQTVRLQLGPNARLEWLPLETLAYDGCQGLNDLSFELAEGAELVAWDVLALGLPASAQPFSRGQMRQRMAWPGHWLEQGQLSADDALLLDGPLGLAGQRCLGTLVFASGTRWSAERREHLLDGLRQTIAASPLAPTCGATSPHEQLIVVRALAPQVEPVMALWQTLWRQWRQQAWGLPSQTPRIWHV